jgi:GNAT superfamily N-acetyltransferase
MSEILRAHSDEQIGACFPVMAQLRPHLTTTTFLERVRQQKRAGYELVYLLSKEEVACVAGYRVSECLAWGRFLYVDDLVTAGGVRSQGHGQKMFAWLVAQARAAGCAELHLDSGVQRFVAHRFYLQQRMDLTSHHFALKLS